MVATREINISAVTESHDSAVQAMAATVDQGIQVSTETNDVAAMQRAGDNGERDTLVEAESRYPRMADPDAYIRGREGTEFPAGTPIVTWPNGVKTFVPFNNVLCEDGQYYSVGALSF